ncbi:spore coat associated protein CotJA [Anaerosacchariphilus polymeriproducens]|uniref:Spore coat associated protein CotJA n=2 Tax=Anaerosacchariphilus polymeriproducens TaxID=1812858 RepID=A0A371ARU1_9FIRM|nr:spore coat associated protein CotJA [Anaerosacchariphilus polymeriproducens]
MNCIPQEMMIKNVRLAAAYVPYQFMCSLYSPMDALKKGTAFPELFSPYNGSDQRYFSQQKEGLF